MAVGQRQRIYSGVRTTYWLAQRQQLKVERKRTGRSDVFLSLLASLLGGSMRWPVSNLNLGGRSPVCVCDVPYAHTGRRSTRHKGDRHGC